MIHPIILYQLIAHHSHPLNLSLWRHLPFCGICLQLVKGDTVGGRFGYFGLFSNKLAMGILESCEGHDTSMMVSLDERLFRDSNVRNLGSEDYYFK